MERPHYQIKLKNCKMKDKDVVEKAYEKALQTVHKCITKYGLYASGGKNGYKGVWSRDSFITMLGASLEPDPEIKGAFKKSLMTLGKFQSRKGQVPNAVLDFHKRKPKVDYLSIDSSLWFIIGHYIYKKIYKDNSFFKENKKKIELALTWLAYQDVGEDSMLEQHPTTDWQDAFPHKYGRTISTQALYYLVLRLTKQRRLARKLKYMTNKHFDTKLWNGEFYYAYRWKNHNKYKEIGEWFDSLGNILAILSNLATKKQAKAIINYIEKKKINKPYPLKSIYPPIKKGDKDWQDYYLDCDAGTPLHYSNGGIWTYIGGFYVLALIKMKKFKQAEKELEKLAEANLKGNVFPEWIHPKTKKTHGVLQAWGAGTFLLAYHSLKRKKVLL